MLRYTSREIFMNNPAPSVSLMHSIVIYSYFFFLSPLIHLFYRFPSSVLHDGRRRPFILFYTFLHIGTYVLIYIYDYYILYCIHTCSSYHYFILLLSSRFICFCCPNLCHSLLAHCTDHCKQNDPLHYYYTPSNYYYLIRSDMY